MLKKTAPPWGPDQTHAIAELKKVAQQPPPLHIPANGIRILQTDASDTHWGAILLESSNGTEHLCGHASGQFKDSEQHYHVIYKEVLAVKNGIKKFQFHLLGHHFQVRMDNSSFPKILEFKNKLLPDKQLLRLHQWFAKYDFTTHHIKGHTNLIPDLLSRPRTISLITSSSSIPLILMAPPGMTFPTRASTQLYFPTNLQCTSLAHLQNYATRWVTRYFNKIPASARRSLLCQTDEHLFLTGLHIDPTRPLTSDELWYTWCLSMLYATTLTFPVNALRDHLWSATNASSLLWTLLEWFSPIPWWRKELDNIYLRCDLFLKPASTKHQYTAVYIIHRPYFQHPTTKLFWTQDQAYEWAVLPSDSSLSTDLNLRDRLYQFLLELNHVTSTSTKLTHTSLGPKHELLSTAGPSSSNHPASSPPGSRPPTGLILKEETLDYNNVLWQDAQDPWGDFISLSAPSQPGPSSDLRNYDDDYDYLYQNRQSSDYDDDCLSQQNLSPSHYV